MIKSSLKCTCFSISTEESIQDVRTAGVLFLLFTERSILPTMLKVLSKCIREYKQASLKAPLMVSLEVVMECIIPFIIAQLVNRMKAGAGFRGSPCMVWYWSLWLRFPLYSASLQVMPAPLLPAGLQRT